MIEREASIRIYNEVLGAKGIKGKLVRVTGEGFYEVYVEASLETCEERDPKGLYQRARAGVIPKFTGISSPYEAPEHPDLRLNTSQLSLDACVRQFHDFIAQAELLRADGHGRPHAVQQERFGT